MNVLTNKFKEVILSVAPISIILLIINFTIAPIHTDLILRFIIGTIFIVLGLSIFLFGADIGIEPVGSLTGSNMTKINRIWLFIIIAFTVGFVITIAEPDLQVLASQIAAVTSGIISKFTILTVVSIGVGILIVVGLIRIIYDISLTKLLTSIYGIIFLLAIFASPEFLAISFDASGSTTGTMSVPFILALGLGVSSIKSGKKSEEDSFGLAGIASTGPIISVILMSLFTKSTKITAALPYDFQVGKGIFRPFINEAPKVLIEALIALFPILIMFCIFQALLFKISHKKFIKILKGLLYTFIGLTLFLIGVNAGFMEAGSAIGYSLASTQHKWVILPISFFIGLAIISAEPAVHILNEQVENVTSGYIKKRVILYALAIGVAFAVTLSMLRIMVPWIKLWHYLLPGYLIAIVISYFVPRIFVGIAFDSGGIASGPMTATFILALAQGVAERIEGANVLIDAFGIIAVISLAPVISMQILGLIYKSKERKGAKLNGSTTI